MIGLLDGVIVDKTPTAMLLDVGGVGYELMVPLSTYERSGNVGDRVKLLTYLHVREDCLQLYGFFAGEEKQMFALLLGVTGIGPKLAIGILSKSSVSDLQRMIAGESVDALTRLPGLGKKTAQRLVIELKDKLQALGLHAVPGQPRGQEASARLEKAEEAILALVSLGFPRNGAEKEVAGMLNTEPEMAVDELVKRILQK
jgi:Holliday junction DNA helicase RuvA